MKLESLFTINEFETDQEEFSATITFDPSHEIFKGHFPGQSVVPGVCLIHITKEIAGLITGKKMQFEKSSNIKFLHIINPDDNPEVNLKGSYSKCETGELKVAAVVSDDNSVFFKFKGQFEDLSI